MGRLDGLKKALQESADKVVQSAQNIPSVVKDADMSQVSDSLKGLAKKGGAAIDAMKEKSRETKKAIQEALTTEDGSINVTTEDALKVMYLLMASDGKIQQDETEKFDSIGCDLDPAFEEHKEKLVQECQTYLRDEFDADEYYENIHDGIGDIIRQAVQKGGTADIHGKLLIWNLFAISYSDSDCTEVERRLIRYASKLLNIDRAIPLEMESTVQTLLAIEKEESWLRESNRPYTEVEVQLNLLAERRQAILQGAHALIVD